MPPGKLSENDFSEALEKLVSLANASPPQALLPLIRRFWDSPDLAFTTPMPGTTDTPQLPPGFVEAVSSYRDDGPESLLRDYPDFAMAVVLTKIWLTKLRDSQLQRWLSARPNSRELRRWVEILLPVARYLEPALDPTVKIREFPEILDCLKDVHWVQPWVGKADLAQSITLYISNKGYIPRNTYQGWRAAGVKHLYLAVQAVIGDTPMTATHIVEALSSMGSIEESEAHDSLPFTMTEAPRVPTTTPATTTLPLIDLPPLPRLRIERQQQPDILAALLEGQHRAFILYGGAGMGKTTLVGQVLRAPEAQAAFPGGIAWAAGNGSAEEIAAAWCTALNLKRRPNTTWTQCWQQAGHTTGRALLVLDDVVTLADAAVLAAGFSPEAALLLTTQFGAETWEALAHSWLEPERIWRMQIGAFTPAEARALVEQAHRRPLTTEEGEVLEQLGVQTGWNPVFWSRVALQTGLEDWRMLLLEMQTYGVTTEQIEVNAQAQWRRMQNSAVQGELIQLGEYFLTPTPFGNGYAAAVWKVQPALVSHRLHRLQALGLIEELEFGDPAGIVKQLWRIRPEILKCFWQPSRFTKWRQDFDFRRRRARLTPSILANTPAGWAIPWQFRLLSFPWFVLTLPWELLGITLQSLHPQLRQRGSWTRRWLRGVERQWQEDAQRRGIQLPIEHHIVTDAANTVFWRVLIGELLLLIAVGAIAGLLLGPWLNSTAKDWLFMWLWTRQGWVVIMGALGLWAILELSRMPWLYYRMGLDYPPLHWLARAARWLGMRDPNVD